MRVRLQQAVRLGVGQQTFANDILDDLGAGSQLHHVQDARAIGADGFDAQMQLRRDFGRRQEFISEFDNGVITRRMKISSRRF